MKCGWQHLLSLLSFLLLQAEFVLLLDAALHAVALGQIDVAVPVLISDDKHVGNTSSEIVSTLVLQVDDIKTAQVLLTVNDLTNTSDVLTTANHGNGTSLELVVLNHFASGDIDLDNVVYPEVGISKAKSASIMSDSVGDNGLLSVEEGIATNGSLLCLRGLNNAAQLELRLLRSEGGKSKASLHIVQKAEVLLGLGDGDDIHETGGIVHVGADFAVDSDMTTHDDDVGLAAAQRVFQAVAKNQG